MPTCVWVWHAVDNEEWGGMTPWLAVWGRVSRTCLLSSLAFRVGVRSRSSSGDVPDQRFRRWTRFASRLSIFS